LLRHSLATRMVNVGVPIKEIADVLGHVSINTTAIYTKVDTTHLAAVALPFPAPPRPVLLHTDKKDSKLRARRFASLPILPVLPFLRRRWWNRQLRRC